MKIAVAFLVNKPQQATIDFAQQVATRTNFDCYIVADCNEQKYQYDKINVYQVADEDCGYYKNSASVDGFTNLKKNPNAWDKMFRLFCGKINPDYDFVWVFEEDVFIPDVSTIENLCTKYKEYDLVTPNNFKKTDKVKDWHWSYILDKWGAPFYYSMVCGFGMSKKLMYEINRFAFRNITLYYHEIMLNTIAMQMGLRVIDAFELKSIVWQGKWGIDEFLLLPNNVFHPIKDINSHPRLRQEIQSAIYYNYTPKNNLPEFISNLM